MSKAIWQQILEEVQTENLSLKKRLSEQPMSTPSPTPATAGHTPRTDELRAKYPFGAAMAYDLCEQLEVELASMTLERNSADRTTAKVVRASENTGKMRTALELVDAMFSSPKSYNARSVCEAVRDALAGGSGQSKEYAALLALLALAQRVAGLSAWPTRESMMAIEAAITEARLVVAAATGGQQP